MSMLFMERMEDNEAIVIRGFEQFSEYSGYASKLNYAGDYIDICKVIFVVYMWEGCGVCLFGEGCVCVFVNSL